MKLRLVRTLPADEPRPTFECTDAHVDVVCLPPRCQLATFEPWCSDQPVAVGANGGHTFIYTIDR